MINQKLSETTVFLGKNKKGTHQRKGYRNEDGLIFIPPASAKRQAFWMQKMKDRGYTFG